MAALVEEKELVVVFEKDVDFKCECGMASLTIKKNGTLEGDEIYTCKDCKDTKSTVLYCEDCGPFLHRKKKGKFVKGHAFDIENDDDNKISSIKAILKKTYDEDKASFGKQVIVAIVGKAAYRQFTKIIRPASGGCAATVGSVMLGLELSSFVNTVRSGADLAKFATKNVTNGCTLTMVGFSCVEIGYNAIRLMRDEISGKEWLRLTGKTVARNAAVYGGVVLGSKIGVCAAAKVGAAIGTSGGPVGTVVGTAVGLIAAIILGCYAGKLADEAYEYFVPKTESKFKSIQIKEAIDYFHFDKEEIDNKDIFNTKEINRRFKRYALECHPDRHNGDQSKWHILSQHYGVLIELASRDEKDKKIVTDIISSPQAIASN